MADGKRFDWRTATRYLDELLPSELRAEEARLAGGGDEAQTVGPAVAQLVAVLIYALRPQHVLEIGTSYGYSAVAMGRALRQVGGKLTTIEIEPRLAMAAEERVQAEGLGEVVDVVIADANEALPHMPGPYGLILQDGGKDDYLRMLPVLLDRLAPSGVLVTDDVLMPVMDDLPDEEKPFRYALTLYNNALQEREDLRTVWLPVGDGVALSVKLG